MVVNGVTSLSAGAGNDIVLNNVDDFVGAVSIASANNVTLNDINALTLGLSTISGSLNITANRLVSDSGALTVGGTTTISAGAASDIILDNADDFVGAVSVLSGRNLVLNKVNRLNLGASTLSGDLVITANRPISDSGNVVVNGATSLAAGTANNIVLDSANDFVGAVSIVGGNNVTLNDINDLTVGGQHRQFGGERGGNNHFQLSKCRRRPECEWEWRDNNNGNVTVAGATGFHRCGQ